MRLRITFAKTNALRYTGHLDLQTIWERTVRRAGLPLAYTQGFHPGPKIQLASALPLGFVGRAEIVDIWLQDNIGAGFIPAQGKRKGRPYTEWLQSAAPPGLTITGVTQVDERAPALQTQVCSAEYEVTLLEPVDHSKLERKLAQIRDAVSLPRERRGKAYDLRPLIEEITLPPVPSPAEQKRGEEVRVFMRLAARPGATGRPEEVLDELGIPSETTRIERTRLILIAQRPSEENDIK
jgi:radical SAM-linked protein